MNWQQETLCAMGWRLPAGARSRAVVWAIAILVSGIWSIRAHAAEQSSPTRVVVDFEDPEAVRLNPIQAKAALVAAGGGRALEITTQAEASWPGVLIEPRQGKWDLSKFDAVKMDVRNLQDVSVRVLLSINNPGADGTRNCNTEAVSVPRRGQATLVVPFGVWHGDPGHPIDQSNVVSMMVLLDRPGRSHRFAVDNIRAVPADEGATDKVFADPFFKQLKPAFGRGVNLGNALEAPKEGEWGVVLKEEYFRLIEAAGFESVRIPVRWSAHAEPTAPYRLDPQFVARVDWAIRQALDQRLYPLVNMHHYGEITERPDEHGKRFLAIWEQIAQHYQDYPDALSFELLNEPHGKLTAEKWNRLLAEAISVVRRTNPKRKIVVGPVGWNSIGELNNLELPEGDRNLIVTFHYYSPFRFTHQGASWVGDQSRAWLGTKWTGTRAERQAITRDLDKAITWAVEHKRPVFLGEFGAFSRADLESRARWTRFVADEALKRKIGFAYWEFCSGFGVFDADRRQWVGPLKEALLPSGGR